MQPNFYVVVVLLFCLKSGMGSDNRRRDVSRPRPAKGGHKAAEGQFPFYIQVITNDDDHRHCGGSIISENYVLTAAHCIHRFNPTEIRVAPGSSPHRLYTNVREVERTFTHPDYKRRELLNDIAVIKLAKPFNLDGKLQSVQLNAQTESISEDQYVLVMGIGLAEDMVDTTDGYLRYSTVQFVSYENCVERWGAVNNKVISPTKQMCAGTNGYGAWKGDSGGPVIMRTTNLELFQLAMTSFGMNDPMEAESEQLSNYPGVYLRIHPFCEWITNVTEGEVKCKLPRDSPSLPIARSHRCGGSSHRSKIYGGTPANEGSWPGHAWIKFTYINETKFCGGSLISNRHVLTAAHCAHFMTPTSTFVSLGSMKSSDNTSFLRVSQIAVHHMYSPEYGINPTELYDIAIVEISTSITFSPAKIEPVKLLKYSSFPGTYACAIGFGAYDVGGELHNHMHETLLETPIPIIPNDICASRWKPLDDGTVTDIADSQLCAGAYGHGTAEGDSGGALMIYTHGQWFQIGITSFGLNDTQYLLQQDEAPGVFTRVSSYCDWIDDMTFGEASCIFPSSIPSSSHIHSLLLHLILLCYFTTYFQ